MAKSKKKFHIILLGTGFGWETEGSPMREGGVYTFTAKEIQIPGSEKKGKRECELNAGNAPVLTIKPSGWDEESEKDKGKKKD